MAVSGRAVPCADTANRFGPSVAPVVVLIVSSPKMWTCWGLLAVLKRPLGVELHECTRPGGKRRAATGHRGRLNSLEQLAFGRPMLNGPFHVGQHTLLTGTAKGQDADDDHLAIFDRQLFALSDGEFRQGDAGLGVFWILPRHPLPIGIAVRARLLC